MKLETAAAALAVLAGAGLFALPAASAAPLTNCDVDTAALALHGEESVVFDQINKMRAEAGLKPVTHTDVMARPAEWASNDSAERGSSPADHVDTLGRDIKTRFAQCGVPTNSPKIAEINFYGTNVEPADAMRFWSNSPGHRAIILDGQLDNVGVAVIYQGDRRHWTVTFANSGGTEQPATVTRENLTGAQHQTEFDSLVAQGYRITDIRVTGGNDPRYSSTWVRNDGRAWQARHDISVDTFDTTSAQLSAQGYKLVHEHRYTVKGQTYVAAIWNK